QGLNPRELARPRTNRRLTLRYGDYHGYSLHLYRKETHPEELREARERSRSAVPAGNAAVVVSRVPAGIHAGRPTQERRPAGRVHFDLPDLEPLGQCPPRVRELFAAAARVRRRRVPATRPHVLLRAARQGPAHH